MARKGLTPEQQRFVDEYLIDRNAVQAYRRTVPGTPYRSAATLSGRMLKKVEVKAEIDAALASERKRLRIGAETVTREVARLAFADLLEVEDAKGKFRRLRDIPIDLRRAISSVKVRREKAQRPNRGGTRVTAEVIEYKLWSKPDALEKLMKRLGLIQEITPLEALLGLLPVDLREEVRTALATSVPTVGGQASDASERP